MTAIAPSHRAATEVPRFALAGSFLEGLAGQDFARIGDALSAGVRLRALLPGGLREWTGAEKIADVFARWFGGTEEIVREAELPFARADAAPELAGQYEGLLAGPDIVWPSRHFMGEPALSCAERTVLLGCVCGFADCWPLMARADVTATTVTWGDWRSGRESWDLSGLRALVFDRGQYERALQLTVRP